MKQLISKHPNGKKLERYWNFFNECLTFNDFQNGLKRIANAYASIKTGKEDLNDFYFPVVKFWQRPYNGTEIKQWNTDVSYKVCGDCLEIFTEAFLSYFDTNPIYGCKSGTYKPTNDDVDLGCDAKYNLEVNGAKAFVQVKYRSNPKDKPFNKDVFSGLVLDAIYSGDYDPNDQQQRLIFITNIPVGTQRSWVTAATPQFRKVMDSDKFKKSVIILGKNEIENEVNGHDGFWESFKNIKFD